ncbi:MAG: 30S ribosomal protein S1 [Desulfomonile tiedjei]|nr:30S ribosomal protein S1 [Desulfomonile tiedjei]
MAEEREDTLQKDDVSENDEAQEDFAALFEAETSRKGSPVQRDSKIEGTVVSIGEEWIFVDIGGKSEGSIARDELLDKNGQLTVGVGDPLTAYVVSTREGEILLSVKMTAVASEEALRDAYRSGVPVEGLVGGERKGGYSVTLFGKQAFCPYSQIDLQSGGKAEDYVGKRLTFRITEYSERGRNIVLSRREILEEERLAQVEQLKGTLRPGDVITGTVQNLTQFGAFVDIGGVEGLIPMSELAWYRVGEAADVLTRGEQISVLVTDVDWDNKRISLSLKQTLEDPWNLVDQKYSGERIATGRVSKLMNFGAFVELEPGIEGLIHISNLGMGRRINHPKEVLSEGDQVDVRVLSVDRSARRIGLELLPDSSQPAPPELKEGDVVAGVVDSVKDYGVFVSLPGNKSGLLHVSEIGGGKTGDLRGRFSVGAAIQVQILAIDPATNKISLSTKAIDITKEQAEFKDFATKAGRSSFGTLGDLLKDKMKK